MGCAFNYIELPSYINFIRDHAFTNCDNLENITIPKSIISIGDGAFSLCDNLESAVISEGVESIGKTILCQQLKGVDEAHKNRAKVLVKKRIDKKDWLSKLQ